MGKVSRFKKVKNIDPYEALHKEEAFLNKLDKKKLDENHESASYKRFKELLNYDPATSKKAQKQKEKTLNQKEGTNKADNKKGPVGKRPGESRADYDRRISKETTEAHIAAARKLNRGVQVKKEYQKQKREKERAKREAKIAANLKKISRKQEIELNEDQSLEESIFSMLK